MAKFGKEEMKKFIETISYKKALEPDIISKLRQAFAIGCTIEEACFYVEINPTTYWRWTTKYPKLKEYIDEMQCRLGLKSKENIAKVIEGGDVGNSWRYLECNQPDMFAPTQKLKIEHSGSITQGDSSNPEDLQAMKEFHEKLKANIIKRNIEKAKQNEQPKTTP